MQPIDANGKHHIGMGRAQRDTPVVMLVKGLDVRVVGLDGELIREFELDPRRDYQPLG